MAYGEPEKAAGGNTRGTEIGPVITLSPDGEFFSFTNFIAMDPDRLRGQPYEELVRLLSGPENGDGTLYWISSSVLEG